MLKINNLKKKIKILIIEFLEMPLKKVNLQLHKANSSAPFPFHEGHEINAAG